MVRKNSGQKLNYRGARSSLFKKSSNLTTFDPYDCEIDDKYFNEYYSALNSGQTDWVIKQSRLNPQFLMPVTPEEIRRKLNSLPTHFLKGLKGVILLGGTSKQLKTAGGNLSCFGAYCYEVIFLFPIPTKQLTTCCVTLPPPHIKKDYEKAGAVYFFKNQKWHRYFSKDALKTFYLNDVLVHELGHHVDAHTKNDSDAERYAEWFAREYGYAKR